MKLKTLGLDAYHKAKSFFERPENNPEEDTTDYTEAQLADKRDRDDEIQYKINKIKRKYKDMIKYENDPLEKRRLKIAMEMEMRQAANQPLSRAEQFAAGSGGEFMKGMNSTSDSDVIQPGYKSFDVDSSPDEIARARTYNKSRQNSARWAKPAAAVGKGLGAFAAASMGGIPGLIAGKAIQHGVPMVQDWWANRKAQQAEDKDADERRYNPNRI
jgi:hypothetical protein